MLVSPGMGLVLIECSGLHGSVNTTGPALTTYSQPGSKQANTPAFF